MVRTIFVLNALAISMQRPRAAMCFSCVASPTSTSLRSSPLGQRYESLAATGRREAWEELMARFDLPLDELRAKLERSRASGTPLIVKQGFDPTRP